MRGGLAEIAETLAMVELGTTAQTERVHDGNSPPKAERAVFLTDPQLHLGRRFCLLLDLHQ